jgi:transcriptional regulator with GAF, ATPase, and Fis domain
MTPMNSPNTFYGTSGSSMKNSHTGGEVSQITGELGGKNTDFEIRSTEAHFYDIVGRSEALKSILREIETVAPADRPY